VAFGQTNREFQLTQKQTQQDLEEIATMLRVTADIKQVSVDGTKRTIVAEGAAGQIAMASWLVSQVDLPGIGSFSGVHEYRRPAGSDDIVRVFYLAHASAPQDRQEIVTTIRSVADIQRIIVYNSLSAVVMRGTGQHISLVAWLVEQLDEPANGFCSRAA
jgi:type II secretory pathway component GspD/PulD (secretin)